MATAKRNEEVVRIPIRTADGHVDYAEIRNPRPATVEALIKRFGATLSAGPPRPTVAIPRGFPAVAARRPREGPSDLRPPKWQAIRDWILSRGAASGYAHTTIELHEQFFDHRLSFIDPSQMPLAKTTGTNHRKARAEIASQSGGKWKGEAVGGRNQGGTTRWTLVQD